MLVAVMLTHIRPEISGANRKFGFTHYLYALCCHGNTDPWTLFVTLVSKGSRISRGDFSPL